MTEGSVNYENTINETTRGADIVNGEDKKNHH